MKKSLLKNLSRTLLVLACAFTANYAWADNVVYSLVGNNADIFGATLWDADNTTNDMALNVNDGVYQWTSNEFTVEAETTIEYKVVTNHSWDNPSYGNGNQNQSYYFAEKTTCTMTFFFDPSDNNKVYARLNNKCTVAGATNGTAAGESDLIFGTSWNANDNVMTTSDYDHFTWTSKEKTLAGENNYVEFKVVKNSTDWIGNDGANIHITAPENGLYILKVTYTIGQTPEGKLYKINTLADLCSDGEVNNNYKISDELLVVDYVTSDNAIFLQCKDNNNSSEKVSPGKNAKGVDQVDFLLNDQNAQNGRAWDQSNWIALWLQGGTNSEMLARAQAAKGHKISGVIGEYSDANNYTMKVQYNDFTIGDAASYTPNVYCVANFNPANLNPANLATANPYFFMTPKVQEICHITYAQWNGSTFTVPSGSQHQGTLDLNYSFNSVQSPNLTKGNLYQFDAIVQLHDVNGAPALKANSGNYRVAPTNLTGGENNNFTAISTIETSNGEVKSVKYVNVAGMVSDRPFQGVNIVVTEYTDGSRTTAKMVK